MMKKNKKRGFLILALTFLFLTLFLSFFSYFSLTGKVIQEASSVDAEGTIWVDKLCFEDGRCVKSADWIEIGFEECDINKTVYDAYLKGKKRLILPKKRCLINETIYIPPNFSLYGSRTIIKANAPLDTMVRLYSINEEGNNILDGFSLNGNELVNRSISIYRRSNLTLSNIKITKNLREAIKITGGKIYVNSTINPEIYNVCRDFNLSLDIKSKLDIKNKNMDEIYREIKKCPRFPYYISEISDDIKIENITISNSFLDNLNENSRKDIYGKVIWAEMVNNLEIANSNIEGKNVGGIGILSWGTNLFIHDNNMKIIQEDSSVVSDDIVSYDAGPFAYIYNNNVSRWISMYNAPGSKIYNNVVKSQGGLPGWAGFEAGDSEDIEVYNNHFEDTTVGIFIDAGRRISNNQKSHNILLENNKIINPKMFGILIWNKQKNQAKNIIIRNNLIYNVSRPEGNQGKGISINYIKDLVIEKNKIEDVDSNGIYISDGENIKLKENEIKCYNRENINAVAILIESSINIEEEDNTVLEC